MRVSLLYNDDAGGSASLDRIRRALMSHGHDLVRVVTNRSDLPRLLDPPVDVVVSAGGDGTAAAAARTLAGSRTPLAVLPLGTANNIARSIGYVGSIEDLIGSWRYERRRPLDLGMARGPWGCRTFVESVGGGVIAAGIEAMRGRPRKPAETPRAKLTRALQGYSEIVERLEPRSCRLVLDGTPLGGQFLMVEVLNTPWIGPNVNLSLDANPSDGLFSVVVAGEHERQALRQYLERRIVDGAGNVTLPTYRARRVDVLGPHTLHVDDEVVDAPPDAPVSVHIEPAALELLEPGAVGTLA